ncbi:MAG: NPCBM/NEW2 domain-containing protein [Kiritimatiellia bacterium]
MIFQVTGDGKLLFDGGVMKINTPAKPADVDLMRRQKTALVVTDARDGCLLRSRGLGRCDGACVRGTGTPPPPPRPFWPRPEPSEPQAMRCGTNEMTVSTGAIEHALEWTGRGLVGGARPALGRAARQGPRPRPAAEIYQEGCSATRPPACSSAARCGRTTTGIQRTKHLEVVNTIRYEQARLQIQHVVWVFPGAPESAHPDPGQGPPEFDPKGLPDRDGTYTDCGTTFLKPGPRADYLPLDFTVRRTGGCTGAVPTTPAAGTSRARTCSASRW